MALRTQEEIQQYLQLEKEKRLKKQQKLKEKQNKIKALEQERKRLHKQHQAQLEKMAQKALKQQNTPTKKTLHVYNSKFIERYTADEELYQTLEELKQDKSGEINWIKWNELVTKTKQILSKL